MLLVDEPQAFVGCILIVMVLWAICRIEHVTTGVTPDLVAKRRNTATPKGD